MVETALLEIIYILFVGLLGMTIITFALVIAIALIISKQK